MTAAVITALAACASPGNSTASEAPQPDVRDGYHPTTQRQTPCEHPPLRPK